MQFDAITEVRINDAMAAIEKELRSALSNPKNFPFRSSHEGYAILAEEVDELWEEIKNNKVPGAIERQREEVTQVGAMAAKYLIQIK